MAELRNIARLVRIIDKENDRLNKDIPPGMPDELAYTASSLVTVVKALELYSKRRFRKDVSYRETDKVFRNAKSELYIEEKVFRIDHGIANANELRNCLKITDDKGRNLIRRRLWVFRVGYWKAVLHDNRHIIQLAAIAGGVVTAICAVLSLYLSTQN